jgi:hypothetical protein
MVLPPNHPKSDRFNIETYGDLEVLKTWPQHCIASGHGEAVELVGGPDLAEELAAHVPSALRSFEKISGGVLQKYVYPINHPK